MNSKMIITIIIGKNSNLSKKLLEKIDNCILISSREILADINELSNFRDKQINIIFNNFQPAVKLNNLDSTTQYINNTIISTSKVLDYFQKTKIHKIIYTSSSSVYGNNILCKENDELKPMNLHASLKIANEKLIEKFCTKNNIDFTIARIFNMYGGNDRFSIISKIIDAAINQKEITIVNNGNAIRDFIHIDDIVDIYKKLLACRGINIVNVGTGNGISIKTILDFLKNNGVVLLTNSLNRDELKISTADNKFLFSISKKKDFKDIEEYLKEKLKI